MKYKNIIVALLVMAMSNCAIAADSSAAIAFEIDAEIIQVETIHETQKVQRSHIEESCRQTAVRESDADDDFIRPSDIIGGAAGALLGSQLGKGNGKTAIAAVGAVLGSRTGRYLENRHRQTTRQAQYVTTCVPRKVWRTDSEIVERYLIHYRWEGHTATIVSDAAPPGKTIRLSVRAVPILSRQSR